MPLKDCLSKSVRKWKRLDFLPVKLYCPMSVCVSNALLSAWELVIVFWIFLNQFQYEPPLVKELIFSPFPYEKMLLLKEEKNDALKLRRRSEPQAAAVWINLISDFCSG